MDLEALYNKRFQKKEREIKNTLWGLICELELQKHISLNDTVIDVGAGYCEFINNIKAKKKIAVDINKDTKNFANKDVDIQVCHYAKIPKKYKSQADIVFISNFLEHLDNKDEIVEVLQISKGLLKKRGKLIILQPNIDLVKSHYWDFIDHKVALNTRSVIEALNLVGLEKVLVIKRFLPYTTKINIPFSEYLLKYYLLIPPAFRLVAGQSLFVFEKN